MTLRDLQKQIASLPEHTPEVETELSQKMLDTIKTIKATELQEALARSGKLHGLEALDLMMLHDVIIMHPLWTGDSYWTKAAFGIFVSHGYKAHIAGRGCPTILAIDYIMSDGWKIMERNG